MKKIFICTILYLSTISSQAQKLSSISISPIYEGNIMTNDGFGKLNEVLRRNNLYTIRNQFMTRGVSLCFSGKKGTGGFQVDYSTLFSFAYDKTSLTNESIVPLITSSQLRFIFFRKLFETKRWYGTAALGFSLIRLNFKLVDRDIQIYPLDSLIANPKLSPSLDVSERRGNFMMDFSSGIYFKTKWFKKAFDDFDIGAKLGYYQPLLKGENEWIVNGTINNVLVKNLPEVSLNNVYFQMTFLIKYNFEPVKDYKNRVNN